MDINSLATVLIAQKTGAVINTNDDDLIIEELFDHQKEAAVVDIFRSPLFSNQNVQIHPNHDLETLGKSALKENLGRCSTVKMNLQNRWPKQFWAR